MKRSDPIINAPRCVIILLSLLAGIHVLGQLLPGELSRWIMLTGAFIPARYAGLAGELPGGVPAAFTSPLTHMFLHAGVLHLAINGLWLLIFGTVIARRIGSIRFFALTLVCGSAGAGLFLAFNPGLIVPMVGASGAVAGLMAASLRIMFSVTDETRGQDLAETASDVRLAGLSVALRDSRIQLASLLFITVNLLALFGIGSMGSEVSIAWEAHLGGYAAGLLLYGYFDVVQHEISHLQNKPSDD